jgi:hypothetical membrane protein
MAHARHVPWWGALSAFAAPCLLIAGSTTAADMQPPGYSAIAETISTLASYGAVDRWIMTDTFLGLGLCVLVTAFGLRTAALPGRLLLAAAGCAVATVAFLPQPASGSSVKHMAVACFAFISLALWPVVGWRRAGDVPRLLRPRVSIAVGGVLLAMCCWYVIELHGNGGVLGLAERSVAICQSLWVLLVALNSTRLAASGGASRISARTNRMLGSGKAIGGPLVPESLDADGAERLAAGLRSEEATGSPPDVLS